MGSSPELLGGQNETLQLVRLEVSAGIMVSVLKSAGVGSQTGRLCPQGLGTTGDNWGQLGRLFFPPCSLEEGEKGNTVLMVSRVRAQGGPSSPREATLGTSCCQVWGRQGPRVPGTDRKSPRGPL